jgi:hypothetical protein
MGPVRRAVAHPAIVDRDKLNDMGPLPAELPRIGKDSSMRPGSRVGLVVVRDCTPQELLRPVGRLRSKASWSAAPGQLGRRPGTRPGCGCLRWRSAGFSAHPARSDQLPPRHTSSCPPSACSTVPVMGVSVIRKLIALAMSSGVPIRPGQPGGHPGRPFLLYLGCGDLVPGRGAHPSGRDRVDADRGRVPAPSARTMASSAPLTMVASALRVRAGRRRCQR